MVRKYRDKRSGINSFHLQSSKKKHFLDYLIWWIARDFLWMLMFFLNTECETGTRNEFVGKDFSRIWILVITYHWWYQSKKIIKNRFYYNATLTRRYVPKYVELVWISYIIKNTVTAERPRNKIAIIKTHRETFQLAKKLKIAWFNAKRQLHN